MPRRRLPWPACPRDGALVDDIVNQVTPMVDQRMYTKEGMMTFSNCVVMARPRVRRAAAFGTPRVGVLGRGLPSGRFWEHRQHQ